jgi:hypothetical protein
VDDAAEEPTQNLMNAQKFAQNVVSFNILDFLPL